MKRMKKEKESGTLLGVGTAFVPVHTFNKEDYVALFAFKETVKGLEKDLLELEEENKNLKKKIELLDNENMCLNAEIKDREEENKKLKEERDKYYAEWHLRHS